MPTRVKAPSRPVPKVEAPKPPAVVAPVPAPQPKQPLSQFTAVAAAPEELMVRFQSQLDRIELLAKATNHTGAQTQQTVQSIAVGLAEAKADIAAKLDAVIARLVAQAATLEQIKQLIDNPLPPGPTEILFTLDTGAGPMIVTDVTLTAGGTLDQINLVDGTTNVILSPSTISWSQFTGVASQADMVMVNSDDGNGFNFTASLTAPTEVASAMATWTDPTGVAPPVVSLQLNFHITGVGPVAPTSILFDEVVGN